MKKKSFKKKTRVRTIKKTPLQIKTDLELFEKGVGRLEELKKELDSLDTRGFYSEEQTIKTKLKNVSDIPAIERGIKNLRLKIEGKYRKPRAKKSHYKKLGEEIRGIKEEVPELKRGIKKLSDKIDDISKKRKGKIDSGVGGLVDDDFNDFLGDIKLKLSGRIKSREKEINDVLRSDLQKREIKFRKKD